MQIKTLHLASPASSAVLDDVAAVHEAAARLGHSLPSLAVHAVAMDQPELPDGLPAHDVPAPALNPPVAFAERCAWERQRQSYQVLPLADGDLYVVGGSAEGVLRGVLAALECLTGVIWAGLRPEDIVFGPTSPLPVGRQSPAIPYRCRDGGPPPGISNADFLTWMSRVGYNGWRRNSASWHRRPREDSEELLAVCQRRCIHVTLGDHAMVLWLPEEEFAQHPDWFGMRDGKRTTHAHVTIPDVPLLDAVLPIQPCYTNPEVVEVITDRIASHLAEWPQVEIFGLWPHDGVNNWCQCPACRAVTPYEQMYQIALRLTEKLPPTVPIELIAYSNLLNVPRRPVRTSNRIFTMLCPYLRPYRQRIFDAGGPPLETGTRYPEPDRINPLDDREYGDLFRRWQRYCRTIGSDLAIFEYGPPFPDETRRTDRTRYMYHPDPSLRQDEIRWYAERGVQVFYLCNQHGGWPDSYHQTALPRLLWNPDLDLDDYQRRYYLAYAGEAGAEIRRQLKGIADVLLSERTPTEALAELEGFLEMLPPTPWVTRYRLWIAYVRLGRHSREEELAGHNEAVIAQEQRIRAFLAEAEAEIQPYTILRAHRTNSEIFEQRARQRLGADASSRYTL